MNIDHSGAFRTKSLDIRKDILRMVSLGEKPRGLLESLSLVELLVYLYWNFLEVSPKNPLDPGQDRFLFGSVEASPAHYAVLVHRGFLPREDIWSYGKLGAVLQGSPDGRRTPGIRYPLSPHGHILGVAAGMALMLRQAEKSNGTSPRVVAILDVLGLQEGVAWEALRIVREFGLKNLSVVVTCPERGKNPVPSVWLDVERIRSRMSLLGWETAEGSGHRYSSIRNAFDFLNQGNSLPRCVFMRTLLGKGIPSLETSLECPDISDRSWLGEAIHELESSVSDVREEEKP